jgi:HSP20 family protein
MTGARRPPVDVWETATAVVIKVMLPGVPEENIKALLYDDVLVVSGTRTDDAGAEERRFHRAEVHYGPLEVTVPLPALVEPEGVEATCGQGVVTIRLAKRKDGGNQGARA